MTKPSGKVGSEISMMDKEFYRLAREHIDTALMDLSTVITYLEIGPPLLRRGTSGRWHTLDITPGCTYTADITKRTPIADSSYAAVICMEVLEHTTNPFAALAEIRRILKPGGLLLASAPFNFREHHPRPDCWRFGRDGWKVLLKDWDDVQLDVLMTPDRFLMPLHINVSARCNKTKDVDASTLTFEDFDT